MRGEPVAAGDRNVALIGPGRAGTTLGLALVDLGWRCVAVAGRAPDAASTMRGRRRLGAPTSLVSEVGRNAELVIVATPDRAIEHAAADRGGVARSRRAGHPPRRVARARRVRAISNSSGPMCASARCTRCSRSRPPRSASNGCRARGPRSRAITMSVNSRAISGLHPVPARRQRTRALPRRRGRGARTTSSRCSARSSGSPRRAVCRSLRSRRSSRRRSTTRSRLGPASALTGPVERGDLVDRRGAPRGARSRRTRRVPRARPRSGPPHRPPRHRPRPSARRHVPGAQAASGSVIEILAP